MAVDPDALQPGAGPPVHLQPRFLLVVLAGGVLGTPARYAVSLLLPTRPGHWPTGTFLTNLLGACLLGVLLEALVRRGPDTGGRRLLRLGLGTGLLGSFTTYSTLAVEADLLLRAHRPGLALLYAGGSAVGGVVLSAVGVALAGRQHLRARR